MRRALIAATATGKTFPNPSSGAWLSAIRGWSGRVHPKPESPTPRWSPFAPPAMRRGVHRVRLPGTVQSLRTHRRVLALVDAGVAKVVVGFVDPIRG